MQFYVSYIPYRNMVNVVKEVINPCCAKCQDELPSRFLFVFRFNVNPLGRFEFWDIDFCHSNRRGALNETEEGGLLLSFQ
jgi:hypothetical protein